MIRPASLIRWGAVAFCAAGLALFPRWTIDDAFISYRYAENLARHGELNWNPGEDPVEGYTGVMLPVLCATWIKSGGDPVTAGRLLGLAGFVLMAVAFAGWLTRLGVGESVRAAAFMGLVTNPILITHATSGLETGLFIGLVVLSLLMLERAAQSKDRGAMAGAWISLLAASLARPEGAALAVLAAGALLWRLCGIGRRRAMVFILICWFMPGTVYFIWRWGYYGRALPNTFYAKQFEGLINPASGARLLEFAHSHLSIPLGVSLVVWLASLARRDVPAPSEDPRAPRLSLWIAAAFCVVLAFAYLRSRLFMNYSHRFFTPILPIAWAAAAVWVSRAMDHARWGDHPHTGRAAIAASVLILLIHAAMYPGERTYAREYALTLEAEHAAIGKQLARIMPRDESVAVVIDAGAVPYYSKLKAWDFGALNDEHLAGSNPAPAEVADYFFRLAPGAAVFTTRNWHRVDYLPESDAITGDRRFANYDLIGKFRVPREAAASSYHQFLYLRSDLRERLGVPALTEP